MRKLPRRLRRSRIHLCQQRLISIKKVCQHLVCPCDLGARKERRERDLANCGLCGQKEGEDGGNVLGSGDWGIERGGVEGKRGGGFDEVVCVEGVVDCGCQVRETR